MSTNKDKYIFAIDLDGTLLKDDKTISKKTKRYLNKLEKQGHYVVISSGRAPRSIHQFREFLEIESPFLGYNGIIAQDPTKTHFDTIEYRLEKDICKKVFNDLKPYSEATMSESDNKIFYDKKDEFLLQFFSPKGMNLIEGDFEKTLDCDPFIYIFHIKDPEVNKPKIVEYFKQFSDYEIRFWWSCPYAEIYRTGISKSYTLKQIARHLNIDDDHIVTFGDADNDIEILSEFKNSFAMVNGQPSIKKIAKYITKKDNNHDGVISSIKLLLKNKL